MTATAAHTLNRSCFCVSVDAAQAYGRAAAAGERASADLRETHPGLFSSQAVFIGREDVDAMQEVVAAVERVVALPAYRAAALEDAPALAERLPERPAVLHGFDFHLTESGPRLIEINTNAGGIALAAEAFRALRLDCQAEHDLRAGFASDLEAALWHMFTDVWREARGSRVLQRIGIIDEHPEGQYLYPEFVLFRALFERHGVSAVIADPRELEYRGGALIHRGKPIDLVYNRLTDFYLEGEGQRALEQAALADAVVLTPDPRAHALYANKRNLARLTDPDWLGRSGLAEADSRTLLRHIPATEIVRREAAERLWASRKRRFFKPARGYGSRGSYRGDKLTRGRFAEILEGDYVAQTLVPPGARQCGPDDHGGFRFDVRSFVYRGRSLMLAARLYRGQTTNFRTLGGGFAPVLYPPPLPWMCQPPEAA